MNVSVLWNILIPIILSFGCGILSSFVWWAITRKILFPTIEISKNIIVESNGSKIVKVRNTHKKYGAYNIVCYAEYVFTYKNRHLTCRLQPREITYLKALGEDDLVVNMPVREISNKDGSKILLSEAFELSNDGKLNIKFVCQNKYGVKRAFPSVIVERELEKISEY